MRSRRGGGGTRPRTAAARRLQASGTDKLLRNDFKLAGAKQDLAQAKKTVKIGFIGDLTGGNASLILSSHGTSQLAVKKANEAGDLPVNLETLLDRQQGRRYRPGPTADSSSGSSTTRPSSASIGPGFSGETEVGAGRLNERATFITPSATNPDLTRKGWEGFFRALANDFVQGGQTGQLIVDVHSGARRSPS